MRGAYPTDLGLIVKSWVQEMRHAPFSKGVPDDVFFAEHRRVVLALVRRAWTTCAVNVEDENHIYGFVTFELAPERLHWVYVKEPYRRIGLGQALLESAFGAPGLWPPRLLCSHASNFAKLLAAQAERRRLVYSPYLLLRDTPDAEPPRSEPERPQTFDGPDSPGP